MVCQEGVKSCQESAKLVPSTYQEAVKRVSREPNGCEQRVKICQEGAKRASGGCQGLRVCQEPGLLVKRVLRGCQKYVKRCERVSSVVKGGGCQGDVKRVSRVVKRVSRDVKGVA